MPILADDECGNCFALAADGRVIFWDHETDELVDLAACLSDFLAGCVEMREIALNPNQVKSVWVDPEFAKSLKMQVPADGWIRKPPKHK